jgi:hypothetical protein
LTGGESKLAALSLFLSEPESVREEQHDRTRSSRYTFSLLRQLAFPCAATLFENYSTIPALASDSCLFQWSV